MTTRPMFVHRVGLACPLGLGAAATAAAMRAGVNRFAELPYADNAGFPLRGSRLESLGPTLSARQRWSALLLGALSDLARKLPSRTFEECSATAVVPSLVHDPDEVDPNTVLAEIRGSLGPRALSGGFRLVRGGAASSYRALAEARSVSQVSPAIVCAADCLTHAHALQHYSRGHRLLSERNADGFLPGEAAAAVLVSGSSQQALGAITGLGFGDEPGLLDNDIPLRATGMVNAARAALAEAGLDMGAMQFRLSDATGESYFFKEQALLVSRVLRRRIEEFPLWTCGPAVGHVGAAAGLLNIGWALETFARGGAPGRLALASAGDDGSARACAVVHCGGSA